MPVTPRRTRAAFCLLALISLLLSAACGGSSATQPAGANSAAGSQRVLRISAIPDQDPSKLVQINSAMAEYLTGALGLKVEYVPVSDYASSVSLFKTGDLDMVFFGGLTGEQARLQTKGAVLLAQRDIDAVFQSVFIVNTTTGIKPVTDARQLSVLNGKRFTFGAETSTSGRLMPAYYLDQAGISADSGFSGPPGYSGSHDKTINLVQSGSYDAGALNLQVWKSRLANGTVDTSKVAEVYTTPTYSDYHWIAGPETDARFGAGFTDKLKAALLGMDYSKPDQARVLDLYGAKKFIPTDVAQYAQVLEIGRKLKLING